MKTIKVFFLLLTLSLFTVNLFSQFDVAWTSLVKTSASGSTLTRINPTGGWGGAASTNKIPANEAGWVELTVASTAANRVFGLSEAETNTDFKTIKFALYILGNKILIYENGAYKRNLGAYSIGDVLRVERTGTSITYKKNQVVLYTSATSSTAELLIDASLLTVGASLPSMKASHCSNNQAVGAACDDGDPATSNDVILADGCTCQGSAASSSPWVKDNNNDISYAPGKVFIGTTTAVEDYELIVQGKVLFEEVMVLESGMWPDYVFDEGYDLRPIEEVARHIEEKHHLPGMPSAAEVADNGLMLGDMQRLTVEKIEELTLYLIEANKEITALKNKNSQLESLLKENNNLMEALLKK